MPWTTPRTWVPGNKLFAAELNIDVRDNTNDLNSRLTDLEQNSLLRSVAVGSQASDKTNNGTGYQDTGLSTTITTSGGKVLLLVSHYYRGERSAETWAGYFRLLRGDSQLTEWELNFEVDNDGGRKYNWDVFSPDWVDEPAAGTYTYKTQLRSKFSDLGNSFIAKAGARLVAIELNI